jgi:hypothetical protein
MEELKVALQLNPEYFQEVERLKLKRESRAYMQI